MYSWGDDMQDWVNPNAYRFDAARAAARAADADAAKANGPRAYHTRHEPVLELTDPSKTVRSESANPLIVAVDVTGSMQTWPAEIFDRLPLLYQTLSQYRPDLEVSFVAIGDAHCDRFPLQVTDFSKGYALEERLKGLYGEGGGGGQARESYELFAYFVAHKVEVPAAAARAAETGEKPFLVLFGDEGFYPEVNAKQAKHFLGAGFMKKVKSDELWRKVLETWDLYHFRKDYDQGDADRQIRAQWADAIGEQRIVRLPAKERAVDYAMGLVARSWGHFDDFRGNLGARQSERTVDAVANSILAIDPAASRLTSGDWSIRGK